MYLLFVGIHIPTHQKWNLPSLMCLRQWKKLLVRLRKTWEMHDTLNAHLRVLQLTVRLLLQDTCGFRRGQRACAHSVLLRIWRSFEDELNGMFFVKTPCRFTITESRGTNLFFESWVLFKAVIKSFLFFFSSCSTFFFFCSGSRSVVITQLGIDYLGLRSLKEISDGDVVIIKSKNLCYTKKSHWKRLFKSESQSATIEEIADDAACGKLHFVSHSIQSDPFVVLFCNFWLCNAQTRSLISKLDNYAGNISSWDCMFLGFFLQLKGTTLVTRSVPRTAAGALAQTCVSPAVTTAVVGAVLTPATSWRGKGGIWVLMPF